MGRTRTYFLLYVENESFQAFYYVVYAAGYPSTCFV